MTLTSLLVAMLGVVPFIPAEVVEERVSIRDLSDALSNPPDELQRRSKRRSDLLYVLIRDELNLDVLPREDKETLSGSVARSQVWIEEVRDQVERMFRACSLPVPLPVSSFETLVEKLVRDEKGGSIPLLVVDVRLQEWSEDGLQLRMRFRLLHLHLSITSTGGRVVSVEQLYADRAIGRSKLPGIKDRFVAAVVDALRDKIALSLAVNPRIEAAWDRKQDRRGAGLLSPSLSEKAE